MNAVHNGVKGRQAPLLSPRSKAACGVCRAYESGGGGQPPTQSDAFGRLLKAEPAPAGAGARSAGRALRVHQRPHIKPGPTMLGPALLCSAAPAAVRCCVTPHTRPPSLATAAGNGKRSHRLRAVVGAPVRPSGPSLPPPAACGPLPCPPWAAGRRPPRPPAAVGVMWRLVAACGGSGQASRQPLHGGTPPQSKAKPLRGRSAGLALLLPRAGCGAGAPGRPGPHKWGLWGRPPLRPRPAGGRSGPWPLAGRTAAQPSRGPGCGLLCSPCPCGGAAISTPPARAPQAGPLPAWRAAGAQEYAACGRDGHTGAPPARPRQAACGGPCLMISGVAKGDKVTRPPVAGPPAPHPTERKDAAR